MDEDALKMVAWRKQTGWALLGFLTICWVCSATAKIHVTHSQAGVFVHDDAAHSNNHRWRREVSKDMRGFNEDQRKAVLDRHNHLRRQEPASDMMRMDWDPELERTAQAWAERCIFDHSPDRSLIKYSYVGENLYAGPGSFDPANVVQLWYDEKADYDYNTLRCTPGKMCGHYTQVVWADSKAVGCGVVYCPVLRQASVFGFDHGYNVVCHYGPGGNYIGEKPYVKGDRCAKCPKDAKYCGDNLCYREWVGFQAANTSRPLLWLQVICCVLLLLLHRRR